MFSVVEIDERVLALRDRINEAECSIREYQEQRNDLSPLFKLPNEIIHQIFDTILDAEFPPLVPFAVWPPGRVPSWIPFTHVCRRLRRLSIEYPHLWSRIGNICGMWSYLLLERSSPGPVDINVDVDHHQPFLALLPESLHRVRKLHLRGNAPNLESAIKLLHKAAPQLIEFDLDRTDCINGGSEEDPILELANTIFSGFPPPIRYLRLGNRISFMNAFPTLSKCGTLRVISDRTGLLSADETRQVLRGAPVLHHFDHLCLRRVDENREKKQAEGLITMDHMGSILIAAEYDHRNTAELFSSIRASSLYNCTIACTHTNSWTTTDTALFEALGCFLRHFPPIISARLEAAGYSRGTSFFGWRIPHQGIAGDLGPIDSITHPYRRTANLQFLLLSGEDIVAFSRLRFFRLLCLHFSLANVATLTINVDFTYEATEWMVMLSPLKRVQSLKLVGSLLTRNLIEAATPPAPTDDTSVVSTYLFPSLSKLTLTCRRLDFGNNPSNEILLVLLPLLARRRFEIGRPLERIVFKECFRYSQETDDALKGLVDVRWDSGGFWRSKSRDWWFALLE